MKLSRHRTRDQRVRYYEEGDSQKCLAAGQVDCAGLAGPLTNRHATSLPVDLSTGQSITVSYPHSKSCLPLTLDISMVVSSRYLRNDHT